MTQRGDEAVGPALPKSGAQIAAVHFWIPERVAAR